MDCSHQIQTPGLIRIATSIAAGPNTNHLRITIRSTANSMFVAFDEECGGSSE